MAYGIGLVFDHQTEVHIREVWCKLASQGFATPLARPGCLPHVSLILSETLRVDDLARDIEGLEYSPHRLEVRCSHVGVFRLSRNSRENSTSFGGRPNISNILAPRGSEI